MIAGLIDGKLIAPFTYTGSGNTDLINFWIYKHLLHKLPPNSVIVLDNARFHNDPFTRKLVEDAGHILLFLPKYSPDLNPIEHFWAYIKSWLRKSLFTIKNKFKFINNFCKRLANK